MTPRMPGHARSAAPRPSPQAPQPGRILTTAACRPDVARALAADPLVLLVGRASADSGERAVDLAVQSVRTGAAALAKSEGILLDDLLPSAEELRAHHRTTVHVERAEALDGSAIHHRWSLYGGPQQGLLILLTTGSGTKVSTDFDQPALHRVARMIYEYRPAAVFARSLTRLGRGHLGPVIEALQAIGDTRSGGPFLGDDNTRLGELDLGMEVNVTVQGVLAKHHAKDTVRGNYAGMRERTGVPHETLPHWWWFGSNRAAPPGLTTLRLRTHDGSYPATAIGPDCPAARPPEALIAGGRPAALTANGKLADQVELVRWLGKNLFTDGCGTREGAAHLAEHGWAPPSVRRRRKVRVVRRKVDGTVTEQIVEEPILPLRAGYDGRNDGRRALKAFLNNLDFYETGELVVRLGDRGEPITIPGVLPPDGRPWITATQARRIRNAEARLHSGPTRKYTFARLPVTVDGEPTVLAPRPRRSDDQLLYYFHRASDPRRAAGEGRAGPLPPLPATVLAQWIAEGLTELALPLSLRLAEQSHRADPWQIQIRILTAEIEELEGHQAAREREIDPATRTESPHALAFVKSQYEKGAVELAAKRETRAAAEHQRDLHRGARPVAGAPLSALVDLAAALPQRYDQGHRLMLRDLIADLSIAVRKRRSTGGRPAYDLTAELTLELHDGTSTWRAVSSHRWTGGAVHRAPARLTAAIDGLYAGVSLQDSLGVDWIDWLAAIRTALGCPGSFQFAYARDARLLRLGMAVLHPRRGAVPVPDYPDQVVRVAGPPVDAAELPQLAAGLGEPVALLQAIRDIYTVPERQARWIRNASPAVAAAYTAAAARHGVLPYRDLPPVLRSGAGRNAHRLAGEWTAAERGTAVLLPCRQCGRTRRAVMLVREVSGSLCLDCRTDRAGVAWDRSYDRFIDRPPRA